MSTNGDFAIIKTIKESNNNLNTISNDIITLNNIVSKESKQDIGNNNLNTINTSITTTNSKLDTLNSKDFSTSALQTTINNSITSTNSKIDILNGKDFSTSAKQDIGNTYLQSLNTNINNSYSALGKINVSNSYEVLASYFDTNFLDFQDYSYTSTGVSINTNTSTLVLASSANTKQFQTKLRMYYEPSKTQTIYFTTRLYDTVNINSNTRIGFYDNDNGIYIGYNGVTNDIQLVRRTKTSGVVVDNIIPRTSFNINTLSGYNFQNFQLFKLEALWFGYAFFKLSIIDNGQIIPVHQEFFTNNSTVPYTQSISLPFFAECISTAGTQNLYITCFSGSIQDGYDKISRTININNGVALRSITTAEVPIIAIRINSSFSKARIKIKGIELYNTNTPANSTTQWLGRMLYADGGLSITGGTFVSQTNSVTEYNLGVTAFTATVQRQIFNNYSVSSLRDSSDIVPFDNEIGFCLIANASDVFLLSAITSNGTVTVGYNIVVQELY